jgi:hypothetical protein
MFLGTLKLHKPTLPKKRKTTFYKCVLDFHFAAIQWVGIIKLLKSLHPNVHLSILAPS